MAAIHYPDGTELWFTRIYNGSPAIYRSRLVIGRWTEPELIISNFAGEPTLDREGNLYFVHHFYKDGKMIEADIYVARRRSKEAPAGMTIFPMVEPLEWTKINGEVGSIIMIDTAILIALRRLLRKHYLSLS